MCSPIISWVLESLPLDGGLQRGSSGSVHTSGGHPSSLTARCAPMGVSLHHGELQLPPEFELNQWFSNFGVIGDRGITYFKMKKIHGPQVQKV